MQSWEQRGKGCKVSWEGHGVSGRLENAAGDGLSLLEVLGRVPDPRSVHGRRHPLGRFWDWQCAPCCAEPQPVRHQPVGSRPGARRLWGSPGSGRRACPRCIRCSAADREAFERELGQWLQERGRLKVRRWPLTVRRCAAFTGIDCPECIWWRRTPIRRGSWWDSRRWVRSGMSWTRWQISMGQSDLPGRVITRCPVHPAGGARMVAQGGTTSLP